MSPAMMRTCALRNAAGVGSEHVTAQRRRPGTAGALLLLPPGRCPPPGAWIDPTWLINISVSTYGSNAAW